jgi:hypothetical protein
MNKHPQVSMLIMIGIILCSAQARGSGDNWKRLSFGRVPVGSHRDTTIRAFYNATTDTVLIQDPGMQLSVFPQAGFSIETPLTKPFVVPPGAFLMMSLRFTPSHSQYAKAYFYGLPRFQHGGVADSIKFILEGNADDGAMVRFSGKIFDTTGTAAPGVRIFCHEMNQFNSIISTKIAEASDSSGSWAVALPADRYYRFQMQYKPDLTDTLFDNGIYDEQWYPRTDELSAVSVYVQSDRGDIDFVLRRKDLTVITGIVDGGYPQGIVCAGEGMAGWGPLVFCVKSLSGAYRRDFRSNRGRPFAFPDHYRYHIAVPRGDTIMVWAEGDVRETIRGTMFDSTRRQYFNEQTSSSAATPVVLNRDVIDTIDFNFLGQFNTASIVMNILNPPTTQGNTLQYFLPDTRFRRANCWLSHKEYRQSLPGTVVLDTKAGRAVTIHAALSLNPDGPLQTLYYQKWYSDNGIDTTVVSMAAGDTLWITMDFSTTPLTDPRQRGTVCGRISSAKVNAENGEGGADILVIDRNTLRIAARLNAVNGGFDVNLPPGDYILCGVGAGSEAPYYAGGEYDWEATPTMTLSPGSRFTAAIDLPTLPGPGNAATTITGKVLFDSAPLRDAVIYAFKHIPGLTRVPGFDKNEPLAMAASDASGAFTISKLPYGRYVLAATRLGYHCQTLLAELSTQQPDRQVEFDLNRKTDIDTTGTVIPSSPGIVIESAYPNPTRSNARLSLRLGESGFCRLSLFDFLGRRVYTHPRTWLEAGARTLDIVPEGVDNGCYQVVVTMNGAIATRTFAIVR